MRKTINGFTIIEMLVVVSIIGILTTIAVVSYTSIQDGVRDANRSSQATVIADALESYYEKNGEYPSCNAMSDTPDNVVSNTLNGIDPGVFTAPSQTDGTNSILPLCSDITSETANNFSYLGDGSSECITTSCQEYTLSYYEGASDSFKSIKSRRSPTLIASNPGTPVISVSLNGANVLASITPLSCSTGSVQYGIRSRTNDGVWGSYSTWSSTTTASQTANEGVKYGYEAEARCYVSDFSYSSAETSSESTYTHPITTVPANPTVSVASSAWPSTQYTWNSASCPVSASARYQYRFTTSYGYDSGWVASSATSANFTSSTYGQTYYLDVQAQCYSAYGAGGWSGTGSASYYRPVPSVDLLVVAGGGGGGRRSDNKSAGAGGAGGYVSASTTVTAQSYAVTVGGGGSGAASDDTRGGQGGNSSFAGYNAVGGGGGGGGGTQSTGGAGGSGGGGKNDNTAGGATIQVSTYGYGNGNNGGTGSNANDSTSGGGGGGGAGSAGGTGGLYAGGYPGNGLSSSITGSSVCYAGGGAGGGRDYRAGVCGGGDGGYDASRNGKPGTANTGGGGGGGHQANNGGAGGSGIVVVRYLTGTMGASGGNSIYTNGSYTIQIFTSSGTLVVY